MVAQSIIDEQRREFGIPSPMFGPPPPVLSMDLSKGLVHTYTLTQNIFVTEPRFPPLPGSLITLILIQDSVGSRSVTWGVCFRDPPGWSAGAANTRATALFIYDGAGYQYIDGSSAFAVNGLQLVPNTGSAILASDPVVSHVDPAPTVGAATLAGVAPVLTRNTIVTRTPTIGALTAAGVAPLVSIILTPPGAALTLLGQIPTRTSP
jgi:hypothetical protein